MMIKFNLLGGLLVMLATSLHLGASEPDVSEESQPDMSAVRIEWKDPENYFDVESADGFDEDFRDNVFFQLEKHIKKIAKQLPEGQRLKMVVTDLDLAGRLWPGMFYGFNGGNDVRIVKTVDFPRVEFQYELTDEQGAMVISGDENLRDMGFQQRVSRVFRSDPLRYEKAMIERWMRATLIN